MTTTVTRLDEGSVQRILFQGPKGIQTFSAATRAQLSEILTELETCDECRVVVFQAEGRTFIAGADITELQQLTPETAREVAREGQMLMNRIADLPALTIVAIHAACAGGGCELSLACDWRFAAENAKIGLPEVSLGLIPGWGGTMRAVSLLGESAARQLILRGELFPATAAKTLGLIHEVWPEDDFANQVEAFIQTALKKGPAAIRQVKKLIADFAAVPRSFHLQAEAETFAECYRNGEAAEGLAAFLEKRPAEWPLA